MEEDGRGGMKITTKTGKQTYPLSLRVSFVEAYFIIINHIFVCFYMKFAVYFLFCWFVFAAIRHLTLFDSQELNIKIELDKFSHL